MTAEVDKVVALLTDQPPKIAAAVEGLPAAQLRTPAAPGEWSATEILAHLRSCEEVWGGCIRTILAEDRPTIRAVNPRTFMESTDYPTLDFAPSYAAFLKHRTALVKTLRSLSPADWERSALVVGAGKPLERTVLSYAKWLAEHERSHVKQLQRLRPA